MTDSSNPSSRSAQDASAKIMNAYERVALSATRLVVPFRFHPQTSPLSLTEMQEQEQSLALLRDLRLDSKKLVGALNLLKNAMLNDNAIPSSTDPVRQAYVYVAQELFLRDLTMLVRAFPESKRDEAKKYLVGLDVERHFVEPYLHLLSPHLISLPQNIGEGSEQFRLSLRQYVSFLTDPAMMNKALSTPKRLKAFSTHARWTLPLLDWGERRRRDRGLVRALEYALDDEEIARYVAVKFLKEKPDTLQFLRESSFIDYLAFSSPSSSQFLRMDLQYRSSISQLFRGVLAQGTQEGRTTHLLRKAMRRHGILPLTPSEQSLEEVATRTAQSIGWRENSPSGTFEWFKHAIDEIDYCTREYRDRVSSRLENPVAGGLLTKGKSGTYEHVDDLLNADAGWIYQNADRVRDTMGGFFANPGKHAEKFVLAGLTFVPFLPKSLKSARGKIAKSVGGMLFVRSLLKRDQTVRENNLHGSVITPNTAGSFLYDHRYLLSALVGWKVLKNIGDGSRHGPIHALSSKIGDLLSSGNFSQLGGNMLEMGLDILEYDPSESRWKLGGDIEAETLPASELVLEYLVDASLGVVRNDVKKIERKIGREIRMYPDNIISRFSAGLYAMETGSLEDAKEQLLDVSGWLSDKRLASRIDELDRSDQRFLTHQIHGASLYYLARIEAMRGREQEAVKKLHEAYEVDRKDASGSAEGFGINRSLSDLLQTKILAPLNFGNRLLIAETVSEQYGVASAVAPLRSLHGDLAMLKPELSPADKGYVARLEALASKLSVSLPKYD